MSKAHDSLIFVGKLVKGYKATDANMRCRGLQFVLGEWSTPVTGEVKMCYNGYHFCKFKSGTERFYPEPSDRLFEVEAEEVYANSDYDGVANKLVCRRIRLVREILTTPPPKAAYAVKPAGAVQPADTDTYNTGNRNTGDNNTGNHNSGDNNTGNYNSGDHNTGDLNYGHYNAGNNNTGNYNSGDHNTGDCNTGNHNTGDGNSGSSNVGRRNTGDCNIGNFNNGHYSNGLSNTGNYNTGNYNSGDHNTGDCNTGNHNTGSQNSGNRNIGNYNSGSGNIGHYHTGWFNTRAAKVRCFDVDTGLTYNAFIKRYPEAYKLTQLLEYPAPIQFREFSRLPGITPEKLKKLHRAHLRAHKKVIKDLFASDVQN